MHKRRAELVKLPSKAKLLDRVKRKLFIRTGDRGEVTGALPLIGGGDQNSVTVFGVNFLQVLEQSVCVAAGASLAISSINYNMHDLSLQ